MATANERQHGGDHYSKRSDYQHWDWVADVKLGYHAGNASRYAYRWRDKNGLEDLEKCLHYIEKSRELNVQGSVVTNRAYSFWNFVMTSCIPQADAALLWYIMEGDWDMAEEVTRHLIHTLGAATKDTKVGFAR